MDGDGVKERPAARIEQRVEEGRVRGRRDYGRGRVFRLDRGVSPLEEIFILDDSRVRQPELVIVDVGPYLPVLDAVLIAIDRRGDVGGPGVEPGGARGRIDVVVRRGRVRRVELRSVIELRDYRDVSGDEIVYERVLVAEAVRAG